MNHFMDIFKYTLRTDYLQFWVFLNAAKYNRTTRDTKTFGTGYCLVVSYG